MSSIRGTSARGFLILATALLAAKEGAVSAPAGTEAAAIKVAFIGNSITAGTMVGGTANAYPALLQKLLGSGYSVQNDGVSATTMLKKGDLPYWTNGLLDSVFALKPDIVILKLGTNDTKPQNWDAHKTDFKNDYSAMVDTLAKMPSHPKIWLVLPVPVLTTNYGINDTALQKIIVIIKQIATEKSLKVVDANMPLQGKTQLYTDDGVHPNAAGEDTLAHIVYRALTAVSTAIHPTQAAKNPIRGTENISGKLGYPYETKTFDSEGEDLEHAP